MPKRNLLILARFDYGFWLLLLKRKELLRLHKSLNPKNFCRFSILLHMKQYGERRKETDGATAHFRCVCAALRSGIYRSEHSKKSCDFVLSKSPAIRKANRKVFPTLSAIGGAYQTVYECFVVDRRCRASRDECNDRKTESSPAAPFCSNGRAVKVVACGFLFPQLSANVPCADN